MLDSFLRHVTKDSYGPVRLEDREEGRFLVHRFHDHFSVLNWGRMPDALVGRGRVSAWVFSVLNSRYCDAESWRQFLRSPEALSFRKSGASLSQGGTVSSGLNALADTLPLRSNFAGSVTEATFKSSDASRAIARSALVQDPSLLFTGTYGYPVCEYFEEVRIPQTLVMGRATLDFETWRSRPGPKRLPFEIECHFVLNASSLERLKTDAISIPKTASLRMLQEGATFDFPLMELVLTADPCERKIGLTEALAITGFTPDRLQELFLQAAWIAAWVRHQIRVFRLHSVRLRFGLDADGANVLLDAFEPDDLMLEGQGAWIHPGALLDYYSKTSWYEGVIRARRHASEFGLTEWKRLCVEPAPFLDPAVKSGFEAEYQGLERMIRGKV
jgi:hypothetical protein